MQQARMHHAYCVGLNPGWKKMRFHLTLNKTCCPNPQPLPQQQVKQHQGTKIKKTMLSVPPSPPLIGFPHKVYNIRIEIQIIIPF